MTGAPYLATALSSPDVGHRSQRERPSQSAPSVSRKSPGSVILRERSERRPPHLPLAKRSEATCRIYHPEQARPHRPSSSLAPASPSAKPAPPSPRANTSASQLDHAQARDAVHATLEVPTLPARTQTPQPQPHRPRKPANRATYLRRPDLGRILSPASPATPPQFPGAEPTLSIVLADGLSAFAVENHAIPLWTRSLPLLPDSLSPTTIVPQARVAIGDAIGAIIQAQLSLVLIGERPGLSSPDSPRSLYHMGAASPAAPTPTATASPTSAMKASAMQKPPAASPSTSTARAGSGPPAPRSKKPRPCHQLPSNSMPHRFHAEQWLPYPLPAALRLLRQPAQPPAPRRTRAAAPH